MRTLLLAILLALALAGCDPQDGEPIRRANGVYTQRGMIYEYTRSDGVLCVAIESMGEPDDFTNYGANVAVSISCGTPE